MHVRIPSSLNISYIEYGLCALYSEVLGVPGTPEYVLKCALTALTYLVPGATVTSTCTVLRGYSRSILQYPVLVQTERL